MNGVYTYTWWHSHSHLMSIVDRRSYQGNTSWPSAGSYLLWVSHFVEGFYPVCSSRWFNPWKEKTERYSEILRAGELHWGSCHSMASQLLLEGCVDAWCFFSAELFDWRNIRITSELRGLRLQPIISSSGLLSWCTNPWRSPQHWRVRLVSHSLNSTPYHEIDWNVGNFSKT